MQTYQAFAIAGMIVIMAVVFPIVTALSKRQGVGKDFWKFGPGRKVNPVALMAVGAFFMAYGVSNGAHVTIVVGVLLLGVGAMQKRSGRTPPGESGPPPYSQPTKPTKPGDNI